MSGPGPQPLPRAPRPPAQRPQARWPGVPAGPAGQGGFMLLSVLLAATIFAFGLLGFTLAYARFTQAITQDQFLRQMTPAGNAFWGIVQANPAIVTSMAGTWTSSNYTTAPAALQPWLAQLMVTSATALPGGRVVIATGGDAVAGGTCSTSTGCTATVTISWTQNANADTGSTTAITRSQTFSYQFGL